MWRVTVLTLLAAAAVAGPQSKPAPKKAQKKPAKAQPIRTTKAKSVANVLQTRRLSVKLEKATLEQFVKYIRAATGLNVIVNKARIEKDGGDVDAMEITIDVKNVRLKDVIELALQGHDLALKLKRNMLVITSKKDARGKPSLQIYSVAHLLVPLRDFPAPDMNIYPSNYEPPEPEEAEVVQTYESSDELAELIRNFTGSGTWEDEGIHLTVFRRHLFIRQYAGVHREIHRFLSQLPH